ncbi:MAG: Uma2 family endonuclease [Cyanobacteria bacterium P01_C01_bin.118]
MSLLHPPVSTDVWTPILWDDFIQLIEQPDHRHHRAYYHNGQMRIETMPTGSDHAREHAILLLLLGLFGMVMGIPLDPRDACSYRKPGSDEFQPDISYYIGANVNCIPKGTRIIDLDEHPKPDLVIEISDTTLADDKGEKRLQYEALRIPEYWIWDVKKSQLIAFSIAPDGSSKRIDTSKVLPDLRLSLIEAALRRVDGADQSAIGTWFMEKIR